MYRNSLDKIVHSYLAAVCSRSFSYECEGRVAKVERKRLTVSPTIFRGYTCPPACGACCPRFSLVYMPSERHPYPLKPFHASFNGRPVLLFHDPQAKGDRFCGNLNRENGRCGIHGAHPFSCDFELIRTHLSEGGARIGLQLYGRAWNMMRIDGERGTACEITPATLDTKRDTERKLGRLLGWATYLGVETHVPAVLQWVRTGPHKEALRL